MENQPDTVSLMQYLMDNIKDNIYFMDRQGRIILINKEGAHWLGYDSPDALLGKSDLDLFSDEHGRQAFDDGQRIMESGIPLLSFEEKETWEDGHVTWVSTSKMPMHNGQGEVVGLFGISRDITEMKEAQLRGIEAHERFQVITEAASDGILMHDVDGVLHYSNTAAETMFGYTHEELAKQRLGDLIPEIVRMQGPARDIFIQLGRKKEGTIFPVEISSSNVTMSNQQLVVTIIRDVSDREQAMKRSRELTAAIEQSDDGFIISDEKGKITYVNPGYEAITGYRQDEVAGQSCMIAKDQDSLEACDLREQTHWKFTREAKRKGGAPYTEECSTFPIYDENEHICNYVTIIRDITEELSRETELRQAQKLESVGQLAAGISHEINTPIQFVGDNIQFINDSISDLLSLCQASEKLLAAARSNTISNELIEELGAALETADLDYLNEELPLAIGQSKEGVQRVSSIVRAMKEFAHPGTTERMPANLNDAIQTTLTVARNEWKFACEVVLELDPGLPPVSCLIGEVNQVILNLIINARDAIVEKQGEGGPMGTLTISTNVENEWVEVRVQDNGGGIPDTIITRIFDPFFTTKEVGKGSGQGLAIAHGVIVKKHQGEFSVDSKPGEGTTFIIRLPINEPA